MEGFINQDGQVIRRKLIVVADDLGASKAVNSGIVSSFVDGIVTSASLLVGMPFTDDGIKKAKDVDLPVGLHLRLTEGPPLTKGPSHVGLCDGDEFLPPIRLLTRLMKGGSQLADVIQAEFRAQMDEFLMITPKPDHINTHHHIHIHPLVLQPLICAVKDLDFPALRWPVEPFLGFGKTKRNGEVMALNILSLLGKKTLRDSGIMTSDHFRGLRLMDGKLNNKILCKTIMKIPKGVTELMVHPAHDNNDTTVGEIEAKALCHSSVQNVINDNNISLSSFRDAVSS